MPIGIPTQVYPHRGGKYITWLLLLCCCCISSIRPTHLAVHDVCGVGVVAILQLEGAHIPHYLQHTVTPYIHFKNVTDMLMCFEHVLAIKHAPLCAVLGS
jgi:hypothetical protein